jgi:hypothetical protein
MPERAGDMHDIVLRMLRQRDEAAVIDADRVWMCLREIIVDQLGVRAEEVTPTAHFIYDLGAG